MASGYCVYGFSTYLYQSFYPPLLYITFLSEFFQVPPPTATIILSKLHPCKVSFPEYALFCLLLVL